MVEGHYFTRQPAHCKQCGAIAGTTHQFWCPYGSGTLYVNETI